MHQSMYSTVPLITFSTTLSSFSTTRPASVEKNDAIAAYLIFNLEKSSKLQVKIGTAFHRREGTSSAQPILL